VHGDQRVLLVVRPGQDQLELKIGQLLGDRGDLGLDFAERVGVVRLLRQIEEQLGLVDSGLKLNPRCDLVAQVGKLLLDRLGGLGVIPETGLGRLLF
jgi:hypothetical protein